MKSYEVLKEIRIRSHLTQSKMAKKLKMSPLTYWKFESGRQQITMDLSNKISQIFKIPFGLALWEDIEKMNISTRDSKNITVASACIKNSVEYMISQIGIQEHSFRSKNNL
jgi:transcriptional regulator with XRE-family HTH domain